MLERLKQPDQALAVAAGLYGAYSAVKGLWNLSRSQGCPKCEATGAALGIGLLALTGWYLTRG
jgi:hypothetical protein